MIYGQHVKPGIDFGRQNGSFCMLPQGKNKNYYLQSCSRFLLMPPYFTHGSYSFLMKCPNEKALRNIFYSEEIKNQRLKTELR